MNEEVERELDIDLMEKFLRPKSLAVFGASSRPTNLARVILENLKNHRYQGRVYGIGRIKEEVYGFPILTSIEEVEEPIDLAVIMVPAPLVPEAMESCGKKGIKAITISTGGFAELGDMGEELERQIREIAGKYNFRFNGPNCLGLINPHNGLCLPFTSIPELKAGKVGIIAQSGGVGLSYVQELMDESIGLSVFISIGNKGDLDEVDFLKMLIADPQTEIICLYLESIKRGREFMEVVGNSPKPVIIHKANRTPTAKLIARSHTAAVLNDDAVFDIAIKKAGGIRVHGVPFAINVVKGFILPASKGNNLAIISRSGGHAVIGADLAYYYNFNLPPFPDYILNLVNERLRAQIINLSNPLDLGVLFDIDTYYEILAEVVKLDQFDAIIFLVSYRDWVPEEQTFFRPKVLKSILTKYNKPIAVILLSWHNGVRNLQKKIDIPLFGTTEEAMYALTQARNWWQRKKKMKQSSPKLKIKSPEEIRCILNICRKENRSPLIFESMKIFQLFQIPFPPYFVAKNKEELVQKINNFNFPIAMKLISTNISHKTDIGGVKLNIKSCEEALKAWQEMENLAKMRISKERIHGFLVQEMVKEGVEMILGGKRDHSFGPVITIGLGGIYVELFRDISSAIAPINREEAYEMIYNLKSAKLFEGFRGRKPLDKEFLVNCMLNLSQLMIYFPEIVEFEINPLIIYPKGGFGVDARIIL